MNRQEARCDTLIETTVAALDEDVVALMLVAVQKDNLVLSVKVALKKSVHQFQRIVGGISSSRRVHSRGGFNNLGAITIVRDCLYPFPFLWASIHSAFVVAHAHEGQCCPNSSM